MKEVWTWVVAATAVVAGLVFLIPDWMAWLHQHPSLMVPLGFVVAAWGALTIYREVRG